MKKLDKTIIEEPWDWRSNRLLLPLRESCPYGVFNQEQHLRDVGDVVNIKRTVMRDLEDRYNETK